MQLDGFDGLVRLAQEGDRSSMDRLFEAMRPYMEKVARDYADPAHAAESVSDLVQESELRAWQRLEQFRGGAGDSDTLAMFHAWVAQIVRRVGLNAVETRNAQRRKDPDRDVVRLGGDGGPGTTSQGEAFEPAGSGSTPSAGYRRDEQARLIQAALEKSPDETGRTVVRLCFFEGLSLRQIAERLGLGYDQVRDRYHSTLKRMERELKGQL